MILTPEIVRRSESYANSVIQGHTDELLRMILEIVDNKFYRNTLIRRLKEKLNG